VWRTSRRGEKSVLDPWDARSLEWMTSNPPKEHNFDSIPTVHALDEFFHRKYEEDHETGSIRKVATAEQIHDELVANADKHIHLPSPSYWPIILALGLPIMAYGLIYARILTVIGGLVVLLAMFAWSLEPSVADDTDYDPPADNGGATKELATLG
jgi:cytochrome c oxidase subunit 1